jgi:hypothetical protein
MLPNVGKQRRNQKELCYESNRYAGGCLFNVCRACVRPIAIEPAVDQRVRSIKLWICSRFNQANSRCKCIQIGTRGRSPPRWSGITPRPASNYRLSNERQGERGASHHARRRPQKQTWMRSEASTASNLTRPKQFDEAHDKTQLKGHEEAVSLFRAYAQNGDNEDLSDGRQRRCHTWNIILGRRGPRIASPAEHIERFNIERTLS